MNVRSRPAANRAAESRGIERLDSTRLIVAMATVYSTFRGRAVSVEYWIPCPDGRDADCVREIHGTILRASLAGLRLRLDDGSRLQLPWAAVESLEPRS